MADLFDHKLQKDTARTAPLADRMRPRTLDELVGQRQLVGPGAPIRVLIEADQTPSMLLWGPPGSGKTTLARIIAKLTKSTFVPLSAVASGIADLKKVVAEATERRKLFSLRTILFVDEIHRWNKAQQDALLPYVEDGTVTLIGATTENPSFSVNAALLSRCRVFLLEMLATEDLRALLERALADKDRGLAGFDVRLTDEALDYLAHIANGDARTALSMLEIAVTSAKKKDAGVVELGLAEVSAAVQKTHLLYDKTGEEHFNIISALHKTMRASDPDAAIYWLGRMLEAGEDPLYVARRLIRFASEDIGLADPQALVQAIAAYEAAHKIGMPECNVNLAQCVAYLARAPKSRAIDSAYAAVKRDIAEQQNDPVPLHLRNVQPLGKQGEQKKPSNLPERLSGKKYLS
ncbi:replication-associated recombination protein A [Patescibacteria group bacterium]|nr:MAG: replication-associated recombination protein A [Patescibacteria group bacterium]